MVLFLAISTHIGWAFLTGLGLCAGFAIINGIVSAGKNFSETIKLNLADGLPWQEALTHNLTPSWVAQRHNSMAPNTDGSI
jgi:hypothetical protein